VVPDRAAQRELLRRTGLHLARAMRSRLAHDRVALGGVARRLGDPRLAIASHQQVLDDRTARLAAIARAAVHRRRSHLARAQERLAFLHPRAVIARERAELQRFSARLEAAWNATFDRRTSSVQRAVVRLDALSPLKVLARGYAIATRADEQAIRGTEDVGPGDSIRVRVHDARIEATVVSVEPIERPR
jgi:exodeoxyribonuclease VII large subunit